MSLPHPTAERARPVHVRPLSPLCDTDSSTTLRASLEISGIQQYEIFAHIDGLPAFEAPDSCDWLALASIFVAMEFGDSLHVHGSVSRSLLINLSEFNAIWNKWRPERYRLIHLVPENVIDDNANTNRSGYLYAFSGGVDACASLMRNLKSGMEWRRRPPAAAMIVHGFDIALDNDQGFNLAYERAHAITASVNLPLVAVKTNLRSLPGNWEDHFGAMVSALLMACGASFKGGVFASDEPYLNPVLPWGSNPVSNPLLSSNNFPIHTDGADMSRLEKVALIAEWHVARDNVRVCWQGNKPGTNCGKCEKCIRSQLELLALGVAEFAAFDSIIEPGDIAGIQIRNPVQMSYIVEILYFAKKSGLSAWWVRELEDLIKRTERYTSPSILCRIKRRLKHLVSQYT